MPDPTFKIDSTTVLSKSGTTVSVDSGLNIKPAINASGTAPIYACRAWVNFDGTDSSSANPLNFSNDNAENEGGANSAGENLCAIRGSGNVSKVVRNGTGDYTITFTTAMPDANYCISGICQRNRSIGSGTYAGIITMPLGSSNYGDAFNTSSIRIQTLFTTGSMLNVDPLTINVAIFG